MITKALDPIVRENLKQRIYESQYQNWLKTSCSAVYFSREDCDEARMIYDEIDERSKIVAEKLLKLRK